MVKKRGKRSKKKFSLKKSFFNKTKSSHKKVKKGFNKRVKKLNKRVKKKRLKRQKKLDKVRKTKEEFNKTFSRDGRLDVVDLHNVKDILSQGSATFFGCYPEDIEKNIKNLGDVLSNKKKISSYDLSEKPKFLKLILKPYYKLDDFIEGRLEKSVAKRKDKGVGNRKEILKQIEEDLRMFSFDKDRFK